MILTNVIVNTVRFNINESVRKPTHFAVVAATYKPRKSEDKNSPDYHFLDSKKSKVIEYKIPFKPAMSGSVISSEKAFKHINSHSDHKKMVDGGLHLTSYKRNKVIAISEEQSYQQLKQQVIKEIEEAQT